MKTPNRLHDEKGATFVILTIFIVAIFGFAGLSIDVGNTLLQRRKIHDACDAGALAAVREWAQERDQSATIAVGQAFCLANGMLEDEVVSIETGVWNHGARTFTPKTSWADTEVPAVRVTGTRYVDMYFARIVGTTAMQPRVESVAVVGRSAARVVPWGVCDSFEPVPCLTVTIQFHEQTGPDAENACTTDGGSMQGNMGLLDLGGKGGGASETRDYIQYGYDDVLRIGDEVNTKTGSVWGPVTKGIDARLGSCGDDGNAICPPYDCSLAPDEGVNDGNMRLAYLPVVPTLDLSGSSSTVTILDFYAVAIDGYDPATKSVTVTFVEAYGGNEVDPNAPPQIGFSNAAALVR